MALDDEHRAKLAALRERAADRPAHLAYIDAVAEAIADAPDSDQLIRRTDDVPVPKGVSARYAEAIADDLYWIFDPTPVPQGHFRSTYSNEYVTRRMTDARAAHDRQRTREHNSAGVEGLLRIPSPDDAS